jgi:hypothetical protein
MFTPFRMFILVCSIAISVIPFIAGFILWSAWAGFSAGWDTVFGFRQGS